MKFLLKSRDIAEENEFALLQAKRRLTRKDPSLEFVIKYADEEDPALNSKHDYCPVGSLEFCLANMPGKPRPINIPPELEDMAGRIVLTQSDMLSAVIKDDRRRVYAKSRDTFKHKGNGFYEAAYLVANREKIFGGDAIQVTTDINVLETKRYENGVPPSVMYNAGSRLVSEWRAFVFKREIVGLKHYSGRVYSVPNEDMLRHMVETYGDSQPKAYTLDVYVAEIGGFGSEKTSVMEVHDFFGCGLYGFDRPEIYPFMCSQWFFEWKLKNT